MVAHIRIGQGLDVHAFEEGEFVTLAGIQIPHTHGLKAHSDGDVVLHALTDALLGALALGILVSIFPIPILALKEQTVEYYSNMSISSY